MEALSCQASPERRGNAAFLPPVSLGDSRIRGALPMPQFPTRIALATVLMFPMPLIPPLSVTPLLAAGFEQQAAPQGEDPPGADDDGTLTPPPTEHNGVITPPPTGDEGIHTDAPNPNAGHDEEVIPPPGTDGGEPDAVPR